MRKILVIDDDKIVTSIYESKLELEGFDVRTAFDGRQGLREAGDFLPDLVLLDLGLPCMSGVEVIRHLRGQESTREIPIIVFTNAYLPKSIRDAWKAGATKCVRKVDCTPKSMVELIRNHFLETAESRPARPDHGDESSRTASASASTAESSINHVLGQAHQSVANMRQGFQRISREPGKGEHDVGIADLYIDNRALTGAAATAGLREAAQLSSALEALLHELRDRPQNITVSSLCTVAQAIDTLADRLNHSTHLYGDLLKRSPNILVVDDDTISREMVCLALEKAGLNCINLESAGIAMEIAKQNRFDLILLDVIMPAISGYDLCTRIRETPRNENTPVIFVTTQSDFINRARSKLSGGVDLIGKPFLLAELAVKALLHLLTPPVRGEDGDEAVPATSKAGRGNPRPPVREPANAIPGSAGLIH